MTKTEFKSVQEALYTALMLLGVYDNQKIHNFMQVSRQESPDVLTLTLKEEPEKPVWAYFQTVEVVTYEDHYEGDLFSFLLETKLSSKKAYDKETVILCYVNKDTRIPNEQYFHDQLKTINPKPQIVVLGRVKNSPSKYLLMQAWPFAATHIFDAASVAKSYPQPPHVMFPRRTMDEKIHFTHTTETKAPTICEVFGIDEKRVKKYLAQKENQ